MSGLQEVFVLVYRASDGLSFYIAGATQNAATACAWQAASYECIVYKMPLEDFKDCSGGHGWDPLTPAPAAAGTPGKE